MSQIKPTQIIPVKANRPNPGSGLPRDLNPIQHNFVLDLTLTQQDSLGDTLTGDVGQVGEAPAPAPQVAQAKALSTLATPAAETQSQSLPQESVISGNDPDPYTPLILGVKDQIISFKPDGTASIDVILEVQYIPEAVEYDIRVAKDAGNL